MGMRKPPPALLEHLRWSIGLSAIEKFGFSRPYSGSSPAYDPTPFSHRGRWLASGGLELSAGARLSCTCASSEAWFFVNERPTWAEGASSGHLASVSELLCIFYPRLCGRDRGGDTSPCPERSMWAQGRPASVLLSHLMRIPGSSVRPDSGITRGNLPTPSRYVCGAGSCGFRIKKWVRPKLVPVSWPSTLVWVPWFPPQDLNTHICTWQPGRCVLNMNGMNEACGGGRTDYLPLFGVLQWKEHLLVQGRGFQLWLR